VTRGEPPGLMHGPAAAEQVHSQMMLDEAVVAPPR